MIQKSFWRLILSITTDVTLVCPESPFVFRNDLANKLSNAVVRMRRDVASLIKLCLAQHLTPPAHLRENRNLPSF